MGEFLFLILIGVGCYILGVATAKNLKRFLLKASSNPRAAIENEIAELRKIANKY